MINLAGNETDKNIKNSLYAILNKIFLVNNDNNNLNELYTNFFNQIYREINNYQLMNNELIDIQMMNKLLIPKYINIICQIILKIITIILIY